MAQRDWRVVPLNWKESHTTLERKLKVGWYDFDGFWNGQQRRVLIRLSMCTLGQEFTTMDFIGELLEDEDYKGCLGGLLESEQKDSCVVVEQVEDLTGVLNVVEDSKGLNVD